MGHASFMFLNWLTIQAINHTNTVMLFSFLVIILMYFSVMWFLSMVLYTHWILIATASRQKVKVSPVHLSAGNSACWEPNRSDHDTTGTCDKMSDSVFHDCTTTRRLLIVFFLNRVSQLCAGSTRNFHTWSLLNSLTWNMSRTKWLMSI